MKLIFVILLVALVLQGCSIQSSQLSSVIDATRNGPKALQNSSWTVRYGKYTAQVYAVSSPKGTLFSNEFGDRFLFDGWSVREVNGLGVNRADWRVKDSNKTRKFIRGNTLVAAHFCSPWRSLNATDAVRHTQKCNGFMSYSNSILIDEKGYVALITQNVNGGNIFLTLSKNK